MRRAVGAPQEVTLERGREVLYKVMRGGSQRTSFFFNLLSCQQGIVVPCHSITSEMLSSRLFQSPGTARHRLTEPLPAISPLFPLLGQSMLAGEAAGV